MSTMDSTMVQRDAISLADVVQLLEFSEGELKNTASISEDASESRSEPEFELKLPTKQKGGRHEIAARWSAAESDALVKIVDRAGGRLHWKQIGEELRKEGFEFRSTNSLRNHFRRVKIGIHRIKTGKAKNRCRLCGVFKAGHSCTAFKNLNDAICPQF